MNIPIVVLAIVILLITVRQIARIRLPVWTIMTTGAATVMLTGAISPVAAAAAIDAEVMQFLFGMLLIGEALVASGLLYALHYRCVQRFRSGRALLFAVMGGSALASALLMNDTLAIVGTPLVLRLAREHDLPESLMLLALAFSVTLGSAMSPIGNPQNLLIATGASLPSPFFIFLISLGLPSVVNLLIAGEWLHWLYRDRIHAADLVHTPVTMPDPRLARLALVSLLLLLLTIAVKVIAMLAGINLTVPLSWIGLAGAVPLLLSKRYRLRLLRGMDWATLALFAAMFVLMKSVWNTGVFQHALSELPLGLTEISSILVLGTGLSQLISNVPLVALYLPLLQSADVGEPGLMALAAGSTLAGNVLILGAASNLIIIQHAEKHDSRLDFWTFARAGIPLTAVNLLIYWAWLEWLGH